MTRSMFANRTGAKFEGRIEGRFYYKMAFQEPHLCLKTMYCYPLGRNGNSPEYFLPSQSVSVRTTLL